MAKVYQWTNDTPLGYMNDELDGLWTPTDANTAAVAALQVNEREIFLPAQVLSNDAGATNPATWNASMAGSRLAAWLIPTGGTNIFFWSFLPTPKSWLSSGLKVKTTYHYGISVNGAALDAIYILSSGYGYDTGDLNTAPNTSWNEAVTPDLSSLVANTMYQQAVTEAGATIGAETMIGVRFNFARGNAAYTYTGNVFLYGIKLELV